MGKKEKKPSSKKKPSKKQGRKRLIPWIGLTLFVSVWMFVLGILVGREMVPVKFDIEKLQNELAALKEAVIKKELDQYKIDSNTDDSKTKMGFYETLKKAGAGAKLKDDTIKRQQKSEPKKTASLQKKKISTQKTDPAPKVKTSDSKEASQNNNKFTIQVASSKDSGIADKLVNRLKKGGYPAYRSIGKVPGKGIWYRVRVGYFNSRSEAGSTLKRLKKEKIDAIIVQHKIDSSADDSKTKMGFYETPKKTGAGAKLKDDTIKRQQKSEPKKTASLQPKKMSNQKTGPAPKVKTLDSKKASQNNNKFTIQIASSKDSGVADRLVSRLKKGGYPAYRSIGKIPGKGIWYRVRVGYFKSRSEAGPTFKRLKKEKIDAIIVQR
jgi:cell division septation protein DedD